MRIRKSKGKHSTSFAVIESYRDRNGKSTSRIVESLGNEEDIRKNHPGVAPETWARAYAEQLTQARKKEQEKIIARYDPTQQLSLHQPRSFAIGYLFLQKIYYELKLDQLCRTIEKQHHFSFDLNEVLSRLLYMRILHPTSKKSSFEQAQELFEPHTVQPQHIYRALDILAQHSEKIQETVYKRSAQLVKRQTQILYYDCTNFFFEIEEGSDRKQYGVSKEHRPNPIIQMGLLMDGSGIPLGFDLFSGEKNEQPTLKSLQKRIMKDFELSKMVVVTDAGLSSTDNRRYNTLGQRAFVTTQSVKKLPKHLKDYALDRKGWRLASAKGSQRRKTYNLDTLDPKKWQTRTFYKERWINENGLEQRLILTFSFKYQQYHEQIRAKQIERAIKKINHPHQLKKKRANDPKRFIRSVTVTSEGEIAEKTQYTLDTQQIAQEAQYDGLYGVCTNLESSPEEIVRINQNRWEIEESFRIMKSELKSRPVYLQKDQRIEAHFLTCFLALLIFRLLEKKMDEAYTCPEIIQTLQKMRLVDVQGQGYTPTYTRTEITDCLHEAFAFRTDYEIISTKSMKKILKASKKRT